MLPNELGDLRLPPMRLMLELLFQRIKNSAVGESQSNGKAERTVQMVEDQIRTVKLALESRIGARIPCSHPVMQWVVLHCADILNKYTVNAPLARALMKKPMGRNHPSAESSWARG